MGMNMAFFRKKPVVVEAMQFTGDNCITILKFIGCPDWDCPELHITDCPVIHTLEGDLHTSPGDWIIKGTAGEFYPCKPDIFENIYEAVTDKEHDHAKAYKRAPS
jgi:hypothetical protein